MGRGSADEPFSPVVPGAVSFCSDMLTNGSCPSGCGGQACKKDGDSAVASCAAAQYSWQRIPLLCTAWEPDAPASETSVVSQPSLFDSQNGDDSPAGYSDVMLMASA